jgi:hypothetical protein
MNVTGKWILAVIVKSMVLAGHPCVAGKCPTPPPRYVAPQTVFDDQATCLQAAAVAKQQPSVQTAVCMQVR